MNKWICRKPAAGVGVLNRPLPPSPRWESHEAVRAQVLPDPGRRLRVLVADDYADAADSLALLVKMWGHHVWTAYAGPEALALALAHLPDVLLLDVAMPGADGYSLARAIRQMPFLRGALLVAVTGYADERHRQLGLEAGFDHYLAKPVPPSVLEDLLLEAAAVGFEAKAPG